MSKYTKISSKKNMFYYREEEIFDVGIVQMILESVPDSKGDKWRCIYFIENAPFGKCIEFHVYGTVANATCYVKKLLEEHYGIL